ncbi:MAG TPA: D-aminoacyl-tRNA deacylase [Gemmatimonadaceae bacterium]|nr:D-aminoacyl-tRNA deacylase [Gemmatimonadaceae bacterium]
MRIVLQRVSRGEVRIRADGAPPRMAGRIEQGFLLLVGFTESDGQEQIEWMADKVTTLRLFPDDEGKMNRGLDDIGGALLIVSQFTLYGDAQKGRRPSFVDAAPPHVAEPLYERFVQACRDRGVRVETGEFRAMMDVELVNDGPVTLVLER